MIYPFKKFIQKMLHHNTNYMNYVNRNLVPCGRLPCYCLLQKDLQRDDKEYLQCYQTWKIHTSKTNVSINIK